MRGGKFLSVNNFSAQEHASSKSRHILKFRVVAVRDMKLSAHVFVEKCILRETAYSNVCLISSDNQWSREPK